MRITEDWSIPLTRAEAFFAAQQGIFVDSDGFTLGNCRVILTELPSGRIGSHAFPRMRLEIDGPDEEVKILHRRFFIRFLSAGG